VVAGTIIKGHRGGTVADPSDEYGYGGIFSVAELKKCI
jgi:hypothetical protein